MSMVDEGRVREGGLFMPDLEVLLRQMPVLSNKYTYPTFVRFRVRVGFGPETLTLVRG